MLTIEDAHGQPDAERRAEVLARAKQCERASVSEQRGEENGSSSVLFGDRDPEQGGKELGEEEDRAACECGKSASFLRPQIGANAPDDAAPESHSSLASATGALSDAKVLDHKVQEGRRGRRRQELACSVESSQLVCAWIRLNSSTKHGDAEHEDGERGQRCRLRELRLVLLVVGRPRATTASATAWREQALSSTGRVWVLVPLATDARRAHRTPSARPVAATRVTDCPQP